MKRVDTSIEIAASAETIWTILTDFERYADWNPFITSVVGQPIVGESLLVEIRPPGQSPMTFRPRILTLSPGRQLTWLGHLLVPGLFDGRHEFRIEPGQTSCRFHHCERFQGLLMVLFGTAQSQATAAGFQAMNQALKVKAETQK